MKVHSNILLELTIEDAGEQTKHYMSFDLVDDETIKKTLDDIKTNGLNEEEMEKLKIKSGKVIDAMLVGFDDLTNETVHALFDMFKPE